VSKHQAPRAPSWLIGFGFASRFALDRIDHVLLCHTDLLYLCCSVEARGFDFNIALPSLGCDSRKAFPRAFTLVHVIRMISHVHPNVRESRDLRACFTSDKFPRKKKDNLRLDQSGYFLFPKHKAETIPRFIIYNFTQVYGEAATCVKPRE
jgi:hypothetical protein